MKKLFYLFVVALTVASCSSEPKYTVTGTLDGADSGMVVLQIRTNGEIKVIDSANLKNNAFKMEGFVEYPQMVTLSMKGERRGLPFFLENSKITISGSIDSLEKASVTGSLSQTELETYRASLEKINVQLEEVYNRYKTAKMAGDNELADSIEKEFEELDNQQTLVSKDFIKEHPKSYVTPLLLSQMSPYFDTAELESALNGLDSSLHKVDIIADLQKRLETLKSVAIGQKAPDFTLNDVNGNPVSLYSKIGGANKVLLLDFWAGWCGPCRNENPNVVKVWKEFSKKGFDVFGVSLDADSSTWKKAILDDQLTWTQVSALKYWNCDAAKLYAVNSIPANFLLDENGTIIANNLRGEDLSAKIKELLGSK